MRPPAQKRYGHPLATLLWIGIIILIVSMITMCVSDKAKAGGWKTVHRYVHPTGKCPAGTKEILASHYWQGQKTASGENFVPSGLTAASRHYAMGSKITVINPRNGKSVVVRINDTGPYGEAYRQGARLDLSLGAAQAIGVSTGYVCVP